MTFSHFSYHPDKYFKDYNISRKRVVIFTRMGSLVDKVINMLGEKEKIWLASLKPVEIEYPNKVNIFQVKKNCTGNPFPSEYCVADYCSPRWSAYPAYNG